jgi:hypothetical protein
MPRLPRLDEPDVLHHIMVHGLSVETYRKTNRDRVRSKWGQKDTDKYKTVVA